jgi:hypothetical protein
MPTPYLEKAALVSKNNEAISEVIKITEKIAGVSVPVDLTGRTFFSQARKTKSPEGVLICTINATVIGNPLNGEVLLQVHENVTETLDPVKGHYDLLSRVEGGRIDNMFMAPFIIEGGVSKWLI